MKVGAVLNRSSSHHPAYRKINETMPIKKNPGAQKKNLAMRQCTAGLRRFHEVRHGSADRFGFKIIFRDLARCFRINSKLGLYDPGL